MLVRHGAERTPPRDHVDDRDADRWVTDASTASTTFTRVRFTANLLDADVDPRAWAVAREAEGWHGLSVADHLYTGNRAYPHVFVTAAALAMATTRPTISTAFVNNLLRSPVEVAQAALQLQVLSGGRFELGLGAGWADEEVIGASLRYPPPGERAGRFAESAQAIRELLHTGACHFTGEHYSIDVPRLGPMPDVPPRLAGSVGGPRTIREVTPHLDRVEIKAQSAATRGGALDLEVMADVTEGHLVDMIAAVRAVRPDIEISMFVLFGVGSDPVTTTVGATMDRGGGLFRRFFGTAEHVAEGLAWLESLGVSSASLSPMSKGAFEQLAPVVL
jgi:alkanesulfonate monooxygenase SsuD/methylene tetrahydromethanopterin reductase-like flavin-dependent oxidoreductase (luciferase family)